MLNDERQGQFAIAGCDRRNAELAFPKVQQEISYAVPVQVLDVTGVDRLGFRTSDAKRCCLGVQQLDIQFI